MSEFCIIFIAFAIVIVVAYLIASFVIKIESKKPPKNNNYDLNNGYIDDTVSKEIDKIYDTYMEITTTLSTIKEIDLLKQKHAELPTEFSNYCKIGEDYNYSETLDVQRSKYVSQLKIQYQIFLSEYAKIENVSPKSLKQICHNLIDDCTDILNDC